PAVRPALDLTVSGQSVGWSEFGIHLNRASKQPERVGDTIFRPPIELCHALQGAGAAIKSLVGLALGALHPKPLLWVRSHPQVLRRVGSGSGRPRQEHDRNGLPTVRIAVAQQGSTGSRSAKLTPIAGSYGARRLCGEQTSRPRPHQAGVVPGSVKAEPCGW